MFVLHYAERRRTHQNLQTRYHKNDVYEGRSYDPRGKRVLAHKDTVKLNSRYSAKETIITKNVDSVSVVKCKKVILEYVIPVTDRIK